MTVEIISQLNHEITHVAGLGIKLTTSGSADRHFYQLRYLAKARVILK